MVSVDYPQTFRGKEFYPAFLKGKYLFHKWLWTLETVLTSDSEISCYWKYPFIFTCREVVPCNPF
jgi:hypothetical protein